MSTVHTAPRQWVTLETGLALQWSDSPPCLQHTKGSLSKNTDMSYSSWPWRLTIALCPIRTEYRLKNNLQIWTCLSELCYQIPQLCKCKCCEVSWNWLNCRVIMFCTPVLDYLTGGLPKQLLDKLVLNRCPKLILQVWKFVEKGGNDKTETKVGFLYIFGSGGRKGHQRIWVIHTFFILQSSLLFLVWQLSGYSAWFLSWGSWVLF